MMNNLAKWTLVGALAVLSACNNQPQMGRVAILDIAVVSEKTGGTEKMGNQLKIMQAKYQADLSKLQSDLQEKISDRQNVCLKAPRGQLNQRLVNTWIRSQKHLKTQHENEKY